MTIQRKSSLYTIINGQLVNKQAPMKSATSSVLKYTHTVNPSPDQYHTKQIQEYRKQVSQLRRNYNDLQRAYWQLLGYQPQEQSKLGISQMKSMISFSLDEMSQKCLSQNNNLQLSSLELNQMINDIGQTKRKLGRLTKSIIQFQTSSPDLMYEQEKGALSDRTQLPTDYEDDFEQNLAFAFRQVEDLKITLENTNFNSEMQMKQIRESYEQHITKLEEILERERKHNKLLNGVISKLRIEISGKDNLIRSVIALKSTDKSCIQKLMRHHKVSI